jgi:hypothetical protein
MSANRHDLPTITRFGDPARSGDVTQCRELRTGQDYRVSTFTQSPISLDQQLAAESLGNPIRSSQASPAPVH